MNRTLHITGGVLILLTSGCATLERSTLLGASIGAAGGTGIGLGVEQSVGSALIGTAIGGFVGAAFGRHLRPIASRLGNVSRETGT